MPSQELQHKTDAQNEVGATNNLERQASAELSKEAFSSVLSEKSNFVSGNTFNTADEHLAKFDLLDKANNKAVGKDELKPLDPKDLDDPTKMKDLLKDAAAAHDAWEKENGKETPWQEFYAHYINERLKASGHEQMNEEELTRLFKETGNAHHDFEEKLGKPDEDWAGWYADYFVNARRNQ
jgi:hypothetical protein